jgi:hypothetical protein
MAVETEGGLMKRKSSLRLVRRLGLALAVAAFAAPGAGAAPQVLYPDDLHATVPHVPAMSLTYADDLLRPVSSEPVAAAPQVLYADDLHSMVPRPISSEPRTEMLVDSLGRPLGPPDVVQPVSHVAAASTGFDWSDASIGAVGAFALMLLGVGVLLAGRHNRRSRLAAA